jgi:sulfite reductase beta subunit-like hemoprotein
MDMAPPPDTPGPITLETSALAEMSKNERIKVESKGLYFVSDGKGNLHTFRDEIDALERGEKPTLGSEAKELSKFHGIYKQQGRGERGKRIADDYFFMVRIKCPTGGALTAAQWSALDDAADQFGDCSSTTSTGASSHRSSVTSRETTVATGRSAHAAT